MTDTLPSSSATAALESRILVIATLVSAQMGFAGCHVGVLETVSAHLLGKG